MKKFREVSSENLQNKICYFIDSNRNELAKICSELIQIKTENPPGDCSGVVNYLREHYQKIGVKFSTMTADRESLGAIELSYPRENFVASLGRSKRSSGLSIGTHMDVVPAGDLLAWRHPPFSGKIINGKIWGRGACDAKCSLAAQLFAARALVECEVDLRKILLLIGTVDDEAPNDITWPGMEFMVKQNGLKKLGIKIPQYAINAEASGLESIWGIFEGGLIMKLRFVGRVGHPPIGVNAIENLVSFWSHIKSRKEFSRAKLVWISGGSKSDFGLTPQLAEMIFKITISEGTSPNDIIRIVKQIIAQRIKDDQKFRIGQLEILSTRPPYEIGSNNALVLALKKAAYKAGFKSSYGGGIVGAGDLSYYLEKGIPGVTFGAGALERCHVPNEFVSIRELVGQTKIYALSALELCN